MKHIFRKKKHLRILRCYLSDLHYDTINTVIKAEVDCNWCKDVTKRLNNNASLIRKYQRRLRLLKF
jgi:ppGpp synthetase/RelA/SpoT-type nucleotidyltranferase